MSKTPLSLKDFGELFRVLVEQSDFNMKEVCELAGIPDQYPSKWRKGYGRVPDFQQIGKAAQVLEVPVEVLIFGIRKTVQVDSVEYEQLVNDRQNLLYAISQYKAQLRENDEPKNRKN